MGYQYVLLFYKRFLSDSQFNPGEDDVGMWMQTTSPLNSLAATDHLVYSVHI